uniref:YkoS n=1 Tax=Geobacillus sp. (strain WCH70) TaxID=471223 RepID=C5D2N3_GEOSW
MTTIEKQLLFFSFLAIALFVSPYFLLGEDAHMRVHDNLDSNIAWYKVVTKSGELFGSVHAVIPQIINGLPRNAFGTEFSGIVWLHALFPSIYAYGLSQAITRVFAFIGMYLLLRKYVVPGEKWVWIRIGASLAFALTPFWPSGMLSTLGMPLALWALLNIRAGERSWVNYLVLTLLPFYSSLVLGFFFFLSAMGIWWLVDVIRGKGWNWRFFFAIVYMTAIYLAVDYRLVHSLLFSDEPTSRDEYFHARLPLWRVIRLIFKNYILGHTHVMTVHGLIILPVTLVALYIVWKKKLWKREKLFVFLHVLNFALSTWYAFWFYKGWVPLTERFDLLDKFNFARYHFLRPMVIYVLFAISLKILWQQGHSWKKACFAALAAQLVVLTAFNEEIAHRNKPSFREFYAEKQFQEIKEHIGLPVHKYRVASIGIHPAIAQYNGFYTLDTYNNFYPLSYKHKFRQIIAKELAKNKKLREYFDEWGGRCYIFVDELGKHYMFNKNSKRTIKHLQLNTNVFREMGGRYIFSALPIENAKQNQLTLEKVFHSKESAWTIYLYKVIP